MQESLAAALDQAESCLRAFRADPATLKSMSEITGMIADAFRQGKKLMTCGNGGSMADAMHVAEEFSGRFRNDRQPYPAMALSDPAHITCVANDYGFEHVFSRMVEAFGKPGDLLLVMSTSGNSQNVVLAAQTARRLGVKVIGGLGRDGGKLAALSDCVLMAPATGSDRIQEIHMLAFHAIIEAVEIELGH